MKKIGLFIIVVFIVNFLIQFTIFREFDSNIIKILIVALVNGLIAFFMFRKISN